MFVRCAPAPNVRHGVRVPLRWKENRFAKRHSAPRFSQARMFPSQGFPETCPLRPDFQCATGFLRTGGFGAAFTSRAPSFIVITNGFAT